MMMVMMKVWTESLPELCLRLRERLVCCPSCARREKERVKGGWWSAKWSVQLVQRSEKGALGFRCDRELRGGDGMFVRRCVRFVLGVSRLICFCCFCPFFKQSGG